MDALLSNLPADVMLEIVACLHLEDALALSLTCHRLQTLSQERTFWARTVESTRIVKPLPCPLHQDLVKLEYSGLKRLALHAIRLERNWSLDKPQILAPIQSFFLGKCEILFNVPGTCLLVTLCSDDGLATCWDTATGKALCSVLTGGRTIFATSEVYEEPEKCSMLLHVGEIGDTGFLCILCVDFKSGRDASIDIVFRLDGLETLVENTVSLFLSLDLVVILGIRDGRFIDIATCTPSSGVTTTTVINIRYWAETRGAGIVQVLAGVIHLLVQESTMDEELPFGGDVAFLHRLLVEAAPTQQTLLQSFPTPPPFAPTDTDQPSYNVDGFRSSQRTGTVLSILSWFSDTPGFCSKAELKYLVPVSFDYSQNICHTVVLEGDLHADPSTGRRLIADSDSCTCCLLLDQGPEKGMSLQLVRYHHENVTTSVHVLDVPRYIDLQEVYGLALDIHRGVVMLLTSDGTLFSIPYA